jgi:myo-inositol 2-dehydrogenase/D-chiro-inositol 1-dehydrogenase
MQLRLGIIGAGPIVEKKHLPALSEVPEIAVLAICRRNEPQLHQLADRFRIAKRYTDYRHVLDQKDIDAVLIATGPEAQPQIVMDAAAAGKHVFVEKPMADSLVLARRMADAIQAAEVHFQIGFNKRFYYGYRQAKQLIQKGELGTVSGISARFWFQAGRRDAMLHNAIHFVDLVHFLMGPVSEVFAHRYRLTTENLGPTVRETVSVSVKFESGAVGNLLLSSLASWNYLNEHVDVIGSNQNALSVEGGRRVRLYQSGEDQPTHIYENTQSVHWWSGNDEQGFVPQLQAFARTILDNANPLTALNDLRLYMAQAEDGIRSLMVLEAMNNSIAHGSNVSIPISNAR